MKENNFRMALDVSDEFSKTLQSKDFPNKHIKQSKIKHLLRKEKKLDNLAALLRHNSSIPDFILITKYPHHFRFIYESKPSSKAAALSRLKGTLYFQSVQERVRIDSASC